MDNFCKNCGKKLDGKECDCNKVIENNIVSKEEKNIDKVDNRFEVKDVKKSINNNDGISVSKTKGSSNISVMLVIILLLVLALLSDILIAKHIKNNFINSLFEGYPVFDTENTDNLYDDTTNSYNDDDLDIDGNISTNNVYINDYESEFYTFDTYGYNSIMLDDSKLELNFITDFSNYNIDTYGMLTNFSDYAYDLNLTVRYYDSFYNEIGSCSTSVSTSFDNYVNGHGFSCKTSFSNLKDGKTPSDIIYRKIFLNSK